MTSYTKPPVRNSWGQTASGADLQDPGNTYTSAGWQIGVKPPRQYFNWVLNYVFAGVRYLCQAGIPDWDANETYQANQYTRDSSGYLYLSLVNNNSSNTPSLSPGQWANPAVRTPSTSLGGWQVTNVSWVQANFLPLGASFGSITGQVANPQVPVGAVTQWQGSLSISGGQVTSAVARANAVYNTTGNYATFNWSGQSGQPSWLWGSNDGVNYFVWNPSNFSVSNASTVAGLSVTSAPSGNTVMARDGNGYAYATYFNQSSPNNENPSISQFMVTNGSDNFPRKASLAAVASALTSQGFLTASNFQGSAGTNGYQKFENGITIQWLTCSPSGGFVSPAFPIAFPNACLCAVATSTGTPTQCNITGFNRTNVTVFNTGGNSFVIAIGF